jgi:membrane associated rhomboid family serine protease
MLLIPIAQEESVVRRTPWVSFLLIALNFVAFLALSGSGPGKEEVEARAAEFFGYLAERPYLEPSPEIAALLGEGFQEDLEKAREAWRSRGGQAPFAELEQGRLDELAAELLRVLRERPSWRFGFVPAEPRPAGAFTSMFVHAEWMHLIGNMLFLFLSGPFIEDCYGRVIYTVLYASSHLAALYAHVAHHAASASPLVGASGAIAGIMGAFLIRLGARRIRFLFLPLPPLPLFRRQVVLPAFVVLPLWLLEQLVYAHVAPEAGVAFWAHVGGFTFGVLAALLLKGLRVEERFIHPAIEKEIGLTQNPGLERALEARLAGDLARARRELAAVLRAEPDNPDAWREAYEAALEAGEPGEAGRAGERLLGLLQRQKEAGLASELAYDRRWREMEGMPARFLMAVAAHLERAGDARSALDDYRTVAERDPADPAALRALVRSAEILTQGGDLKGAREAFARAAAHPACVDPWPAVIERGLRALGG